MIIVSTAQYRQGNHIGDLSCAQILTVNMGVQGLWQLIQSTGKPVSLQTLEGKILAIGILCWLTSCSVSQGVKI